MFSGVSWRWYQCMWVSFWDIKILRILIYLFNYFSSTHVRMHKWRILLLKRLLWSMFYHPWFILYVDFVSGDYLASPSLMPSTCVISGGNDAFRWISKNSKYFARTSVDISNILYCFSHLLYSGKYSYKSIFYLLSFCKLTI